MPDFAGELETHLTVDLADPARWAKLRPLAEELGLKCVHILLDRGGSPSQPMLTRQARGNLPGELAAAEEIRRRLESEGFLVRRVKIEAAPWNQDIPRCIADAELHPARYFESHVKLLMPPAIDVAPLIAVAQQHSAHVSRNALRMRDDANSERFVTQRCYRVGFGEAHERLQGLLQDLQHLNLSVLEVEEEYVVFDSDVSIDAGWIEQKTK